MAKTIENLFFYLSAASDVIILLIYLANFKKVKDEKQLWLVPIYCATSIVLNVVTIDFVPIPYRYIYYTSFTLIEYSIFAYFFYLIIRNPRFHKVILALSVVFLAFIAYYLIRLRQGSVDSLSIAIETILIMLYSFWFLYEQTNNSNNLFIYNKYEFWIVVGLLIYLAGSFFIYIFANLLGKAKYYWYLTNVFYIIKNVFFGIAILNLARKRQKPANASNGLHPLFR